MPLVGAVENRLRLLKLLRGDDGDETDAHVEGAEHFVLLDIAEVLEMGEQRRNLPGGEVYDRVQTLGENARQVLRDAAAGDVGHARDKAARGELPDDAEVAAVRAHEGRAGLVLELVDVVIGAIFCDFKQQLAGERVAVGMETIRREPKEDVAGLDLLAGDDVGPVDRADDGAGEIVLAIGVETGHLGCFAADERATVGAAGLGDAADDGLDGVIVLGEPAGGEIVEEEEGCGTLDGDVVDAVIDEVRADGVVDSELEGDLELGADAVGGGDEDGVGKLDEIECEEAAEAADL